ncbi:MAG: DUF1284 domain-containing protein [Clostridium sp.]|uniref:DUF1284 domain-containing protein n=1 Tax=Clostridium sp. TaxID=1506 RepID=UPI002FC79839
MIKLRPHHIMCLKFFKGVGYSDEFTKNMAQIHSTLVNGDEVISLVNGDDNICSKCPSLKNGICDSEENVSLLDRGALEALSMKTGHEYRYNDLASHRDKVLDKALHGKICSTCQWYKEGVCRL